MTVNRDLVPSAWGSRRVREGQLLPTDAKSLGWEWARWGGETYGTSIDFASEAGDLRLSSIVMACLHWVTTNWGYTFPFVERAADGGKYAPVATHPVTALLRRPNPWYSGALLWKPLLIDYAFGNAYLRKERNAAGRVVELWYEPAATIAVRGSETDWISHYEVWRNNRWYRREVADVIHLRNGLNPDNPRYGLSRLASALRQVYTDKGVENFNALLLRNLGMAGVVVAPGEAGGYWTQEQAQTVQALLQAKTAGDNRGLVTVLQQPMRLDYTSRSPADLQIQAMSDQPEERICALLGIHPAVVGLGVGLEHSTYSNMREAIAAAYEGNLIPTMHSFADELTQQLLPDFGDPATERVAWDQTRFNALTENRMEKAAIGALLFDKGLATRDEGRDLAGLPATADGTGGTYKAPAPADFGGAPMGDKAWEPDASKALNPTEVAAFMHTLEAYFNRQYGRAAANVRNGSG